MLSNNHFLPLRHKKIKHVNENYFPNIALLFVASKKFLQQAMLLTISSQGMHDWSRTDLTWQRNWKEKRGDMSCLDCLSVPSSRGRVSPQARAECVAGGMPLPLQLAPRAGCALLCPEGKHKWTRYEAPSWQKAISGHHGQLIPLVLSPTVPHDPSGRGKDFMSFSSEVLQPCSLHCCAPPCTPVACLPHHFWKVIHARDIQYSLGRICGSSGRKGNIHLRHSARLQQWLCTARSRNETRHFCAKTSNKQWRCQQQNLRSHLNHFPYWFISTWIFLLHTKAFFSSLLNQCRGAKISRSPRS